MVTTVGTESTAAKLVQNLLQLEHDAIAAYDATLERLKDPAHSGRIAEFRGDHARHVEELKEMAARMDIHVPTEADTKSLLTTGKVAMAKLGGDSAVLSAMKTNEDDTVAAYRHASENAEADAGMKRVFERALEDELRHRAYMEEEGMGG
jgi:rubrerythrin